MVGRIEDVRRPLAPDEQTIVAHELELAQRVRESARTPVRYLAHLQVSTQGRTRDVLLGEQTFVQGDIPVVDWQKAPLAEVFFEAQPGDDYELEVGERVLEGTVLQRNLVHFERGELTAITTPERLLLREGDQWWSSARPVLAFIERDAASRRRRASPLAVELDEHQRRAVEQPRTQSVLVLGDAGHGKTTVALHRVVVLQKQAIERERPFSALVLVPTEGLARLSRLALSRLGAVGVEVDTFEAWIARQAHAVFPGLPERTSTHASGFVSRLKRHPALDTAIERVSAGTAAMKELKEVAPKAHARRRDLLHLFGDRTVLEAVVAASDGSIPPGAVDEVIAHTRVQFEQTTEQAFAHVDAERLKTVDGLRIDAGTPREDADSIDSEDFAVLFAINRRKTGTDAGPRGRLQRYDHIVLDEAQEFAQIELAVVGRALTAEGSLTVAGDEKQQVLGSTVWRGWDETLQTLGPRDFARVTLEESYRCPPGVESVARRLFASPPGPLTDDGTVRFARHPHACHLLTWLGDGLRELVSSDPNATVAVAVRSSAAARTLHEALLRSIPVHLALAGDFRFRPGVQVTSVDEIKGLEFDFVVLPDVTPSSYPATIEARKALYVAMTRTTHQLWLATPSTWSPLVADVATS